MLTSESVQILFGISISATMSVVTGKSLRGRGNGVLFAEVPGARMIFTLSAAVSCAPLSSARMMSAICLKAFDVIPYMLSWRPRGGLVRLVYTGYATCSGDAFHWMQYAHTWIKLVSSAEVATISGFKFYYCVSSTLTGIILHISTYYGP
ncbi:hypothetical protein C2E23DRAFT_53093 [Lenzites betulinus]|nr:hypothetical protein C2E23DRAFT_53093 [Lenzites betulinus]